jgi:outer membrane protein assembly factor BamB
MAWLFKAPDDVGGRLDSTAVVTDEYIYVGAAPGGTKPSGTVYCLNRATGAKEWEFDNDLKMKPVFCSPCLADGKIFIGEGYHEDDHCHMFCLDAKTGKKLWAFPTKSHTESTPVVVKDRVYFGAGGDGIYCVDVNTGKEVWHQFEDLHIDASPTVVDGHLYGGSGYAAEKWVFCLDAEKGTPIWRVPSRYNVFGSATVFGNQLFFGTGNGNMLESDSHPQGALLCLDTTTGAYLWPPFEVPDSILTRPAADLKHVFFGSRDGHLYCVGRDDGKLRWKKPLGGPVVASPALVTCEHCGHSSTVYAAAANGQLWCLDPADGHEYWSFTVPSEADYPRPQIISSPRVFVDVKKGRRQIVFGFDLLDKESDQVSKPRMCCVEDLYPWPVLKE